MKSQETSKVSYRAALVIFGAVAAIVVLAGLYPAKAGNAATPEKSIGVKAEASRSLSVKDWQMLVK